MVYYTGLFLLSFNRSTNFMAQLLAMELFVLRFEIEKSISIEKIKKALDFVLENLPKQTREGNEMK